jgi:hypothetical protein
MPFPDPEPGLVAGDFDDDAAIAVAQAVEQDLVNGLAGVFDPGPGGFAFAASVHAGPTIISSADGRAWSFAWQYHATPVEGRGLPARDVWILGTTHVDKDNKETTDLWRYTRYIDWHSVFVDLGAAAAGRIVG